MKKFLMILVAVIGLGISANAAGDVTGSCKIPLTNNYITVKSSSNGYVYITNNSNQHDVEEVTITISYYDSRDNYQTKTKTISVNKGVVGLNISDKFGLAGSQIKVVDVSVENPICKN